MEDKKIPASVPATISETEASKFKGYSLDDLRYRRALVALQKEFAKSKILSDAHKIRRHSPFSPNFAEGKGAMGKFGAVAGKILNGFNYFDYVMLGITLFNSGKKVFRLFKKKK